MATLFTSVGCGQDTLDESQLLRDLEVLSSDAFRGRLAASASGERARAYLDERFHDIGIQPCGGELGQSFPIRGNARGVNLIGKIEGIVTPNLHIVISAHYDHLGVRNGDIYNGADDNASGTAALLAVAKYFIAHPPVHSLIIAAFDAEEMGLVGARSFVDDPCIPVESIALNINMDMISRSNAHELYAAGIGHYPYLKKHVEGIDHDRDFTLRFGHDMQGEGLRDWTGSSDHAPFHAAGIPFVYFGVEDHDGYHQPTDDFDEITPKFYLAVVEGLIELVSRMDAAAEELIEQR